MRRGQRIFTRHSVSNPSDRPIRRCELRQADLGYCGLPYSIPQPVARVSLGSGRFPSKSA
jgi:hypothetical protein